jgi:hypothetical protein
MPCFKEWLGDWMQVVPLMLGFFAYKAAALIQAYRDNKDLLLIISKGNDDSNV